jgi:phosphoglycolate phosphatase-like HAD superfamily hydrolase
MDAFSVVVFDIDGTIANNDHRKHYLNKSPKDWYRYNEGMLGDGVYHDIVHLMSQLSYNNKVILCTGREEVFAPVVWSWLQKNNLTEYVYDLYMRPTKDYRSDAIVKVELLEKITHDYARPWMWFDDRQQVVDAIRAQGIRVLQVQPGDF